MIRRTSLLLLGPCCVCGRIGCSRSGQEWLYHVGDPHRLYCPEHRPDRQFSSPEPDLSFAQCHEDQALPRRSGRPSR